MRNIEAFRVVVPNGIRLRSLKRLRHRFVGECSNHELGLAFCLGLNSLTVEEIDDICLKHENQMR